MDRNKTNYLWGGDKPGRTLTLGLQSFQSQNAGTMWNQVMAAACISVFPIIILYLIFNKFFLVGLRMDGTVVAVGNNEYGQCDVSGWTDIVSVAAGGAYTIGLKADGTVVAVGKNIPH